jgi:hypothetical protein
MIDLPSLPQDSSGRLPRHSRVRDRVIISVVPTLAGLGSLLRGPPLISGRAAGLGVTTSCSQSAELFPPRSNCPTRLRQLSRVHGSRRNEPYDRRLSSAA